MILTQFQIQPGSKICTCQFDQLDQLDVGSIVSFDNLDLEVVEINGLLNEVKFQIPSTDSVAAEVRFQERNFLNVGTHYWAKAEVG